MLASINVNNRMFIDLSSWAAYSFTKWCIRYRLSLEHRPTAKYDKTSAQFDAYTVLGLQNLVLKPSAQYEK